MSALADFGAKTIAHFKYGDETAVSCCRCSLCPPRLDCANGERRHCHAGGLGRVHVGGRGCHRGQLLRARAACGGGRALVSDTSNHRVRAVSAEGDVTTLLGSGTSGAVALAVALALAAGDAAALAVALAVGRAIAVGGGAARVAVGSSAVNQPKPVLRGGGERGDEQATARVRGGQLRRKCRKSRRRS